MKKTDAENSIALQQFLRLPEKIAPHIIESIVPVWRDGRDGGRILVGTAFFVERGGRSFLVTAYHNFSENVNFHLKVDFAGVIWTLNHMSQRISVSDDLWMAETEDGMHGHLQTITVSLLLRDDPQACCFGTGAVLIGYPGELSLGKGEFEALAISTTLELRDLTTQNKLPEALVFNIHDDFLATAEGLQIMSRPEIYGMSGGPAFSWTGATVPDGNEVVLNYFLQGMIVSWQPYLGYVVACNAARIAALADTF